MDFFSTEKLEEVSKYIEELRAQDDRSCVIMIRFGSASAEPSVR